MASSLAPPLTPGTRAHPERQVDPDALVAWLCDLEHEHGLFERRLGGVRFWHLIRMPVYCRLAMAAGLMQSNRLTSYKSVPGGMRESAGGGLVPLARGAVENLVIPAQTRFDAPRGRIEPLTARVLAELAPGQARVLELVRVDPRDCDYLRHGDVVRAAGANALIARLAALAARTDRLRGALRRDADTVALLEGPVREALERRGCDGADLYGLALSAACSYRGARAVWGVLMRRWRPRRVFLTVSYGKEALLDAARASGAAIVEFQHGLVRRHHVGYHFPFGVHDSGRPDLLALFGEYWRGDAAFAPRTASAVVGSVRAGSVRPPLAGGARHDGVLVLSGQPFEGEQVIRHAVAIAAAHPGRRVTVRTHPNQRVEYARALSGLANVALDPGDRPVEHALAAASHVVTGCSTALFEGLALGCRTLLVDSGHTRWIVDALGADALRVVTDPEQAARELDRAPPAPDMTRFIASPVEPLLPRLEAALADARPA